MKKVLSLILAALLLVPVACAETVDLSSLAYEELIQLRARITEEIVARPEWKEVKVPAGTYIVGQDIPAGSYSITFEYEDQYCIVSIYPDKEHMQLRDRLFHDQLSSWDHRMVFGKVDLKEGNVIELSCETVFRPPVALAF